MKTIYLDVRTPIEYAEGHYPGAINFPLELFQDGQFPDGDQVSRDDEIKVYCRSGGRAGVAETILSSAGYQNVENVGGLDDLKHS